MLKPVGNRICVKAIEKPTKTESGLFIPDTVKNDAMEGTVLSVGSGIIRKGKRKTFEVKPGDRIVFAAWGAVEIEVDKEKLLLMEESNIIGVIKA